MLELVELTGKTLKNNYLGTPRTSCKPIDYVTSRRVRVNLEGTEYERTVHVRELWRNWKDTNRLCYFVIISGVFYEIEH